jgi:hypothetical protein
LLLASASFGCASESIPPVDKTAPTDPGVNVGFPIPPPPKGG